MNNEDNRDDIRARIQTAKRVYNRALARELDLLGEPLCPLNLRRRVTEDRLAAWNLLLAEVAKLKRPQE
jgi:hypothetical protein